MKLFEKAEELDRQLEEAAEYAQKVRKLLPHIDIYPSVMAAKAAWISSSINPVVPFVDDAITGMAIREVLNKRPDSVVGGERNSKGVLTPPASSRVITP